MSIGVWEPGPKKKGGSLATEHLQQLADQFEHADVDNLAASMTLSGEQWLMTLERESWQIAADLDDVTIINLVRFFTLVEMQIAGWDAGNKSPVIPLVKILKARDSFPSDLRKWIKKNTENRYLPNGSAL